ncbi:hypothetical protein SAMN06265338_101364 [Rhodoblastus acidophilus]|uniref:Uncharacterized protein n=1 Tax=Rhodoblastus acidophilus TaxID=1074 RepID=A0A212Q3B4_RHOAC|nr:hypothetical protein [Rhodoblastus acidophilus]PPQ37162.1 hypothetical protein CKO16_15400 [Rhodoblastus acidophilus]RAI18129.1 hypothetical protein CH337_14925 [Rhodoblastus acidophilus]SNB53658.1 hypothetical protein SAMN06265338_101364 [Rhodoblastus acidophilus]
MSDILLLGAARSGLSATAQSLVAACGAERVDARGLSPQALPAAAGKIRLLCAGDDAPDIAQLRAAPAWLDALPEARALVVWRSAVDFVNSRLRARPGADFIDHCVLWTRAQRAARDLAERHAGRVLAVEQRRLLAEPQTVAEEMRRFLGAPEFSASAAARTLAAARPGRSAAMMGAAVDNPAQTGWSMAEVELFLSICGAESHPGESAALLRAAESRRPIDLRQALLDRASPQGVRIEPAEARGGAAVVRFPRRSDAASAQPEALRLFSIEAGGRRMARLCLKALEGEGEAQFEIVESLTRKPLCVERLALSGGAELNLARLLPPHGGLIDLTIARAVHDGGGAFAIERASLSTA